MMKTDVLISVIIPVYNIEKYLERCVKSVCAQTYTSLEIILVDDGSTDSSGELCDKFAKEDARIKVFHKENGGSSSARNLGLQNATGDYFGFVDSDDFVSETMYESLLHAVQKSEMEIAQVGRDEIDEQGNMRPNICEPPKDVEEIAAATFVRELLMHRGDCSFCTKLVSARLFADKQFPIGELNEDFKLLMQMLQETKGVVSLPEQSYHVFYRIGSNTRKKDKNEFSRVYMDCVRNADLAKEFIESMPGIDQEYRKELRSIALRFGIFQRLEYLLHIPIALMTGGNADYKEVCKYMKRNVCRGLKNKYLTTKNKIYLLLFAVAPKGIRVVHSKIKRL